MEWPIVSSCCFRIFRVYIRFEVSALDRSEPFLKGPTGIDAEMHAGREANRRQYRPQELHQ